MADRVLYLTHKEIEIIQRALGIAENKFAQLRKQYIDETINVRGVDSKKTVIDEETKNLFDKENEFCDLLISIRNGEKDFQN